MLPQCSHITKKRGIYYYRRRLPSGHSGEVAVSLRTRDYRHAEWLSAQLDIQYLRVLASVTKKTVPTDLPKIVRAYLKRALEHDLLRREASSHRSVFGLTPDPGQTVMEADLEWIEAELKAAKSELVNRKYDHQRPLISHLMEEHGLAEEHREALAHGILQARVQMWETIRQRTLGVFEPIQFDDPIPSQQEPSHTSPQTAPNGDTLSNVLPAFLTMMEKDEGWRGQTLAQSRATYRMFIECCGDRPVSQYQRKDLTLFFDLLRSLPALYAKSKEWSGLPLSEIARRSAGAEYPRLTMKTVKRHFSALGRLFSYLKRAEPTLERTLRTASSFPISAGQTRSATCGKAKRCGNSLARRFGRAAYPLGIALRRGLTSSRMRNTGSPFSGSSMATA